MFAVLLVVMFGILLLIGGRSFQQAPPLPEQVVMVDGAASSVVFTSSDIHDGRDVWRRLGGMELGSVWGHGGYLAPDWTADVLHREALARGRRRPCRRLGARAGRPHRGTCRTHSRQYLRSRDQADRHLA